VRLPMILLLCAATFFPEMFAAHAAAQPTPVRTVLANAGLSSVADEPVHYKLLRVSVPAGQSTSHRGANGFIFQISGALAVTTDADNRTLRAGEAMFLGRGRNAALKAVGPDTAVFMYFLLQQATELDKPAVGPPAVVSELSRTAPLPGLKPGPYEFTLTRVTFPPRYLTNPPHYRSGGALYYVLAGAGALSADGKNETKPAGTPYFEPFGWVHTWNNPSDVPLTIVQANISPEGVPVVIFNSPPK